MILDQRVNIYALETLEKLCTLETAPNPKVQPASMPCVHFSRVWLLFPCSGEYAYWWLQQGDAV